MYTRMSAPWSSVFNLTSRKGSKKKSNAAKSRSSPTPMSSEAAAVLVAPSSLASVAAGPRRPSPTAILSPALNSASSDAARPHRPSPTTVDDTAAVTTVPSPSEAVAVTRTAPLLQETTPRSVQPLKAPGSNIAAVFGAPSSLASVAAGAPRSSSTEKLSTLANPASSNAARSRSQSEITSSEATAAVTTAPSPSEAVAVSRTAPSLQDATPRSVQPSIAPGSHTFPTLESVVDSLAPEAAGAKKAGSSSLEAEVESSYVIQETQEDVNDVTFESAQHSTNYSLSFLEDDEEEVSDDDHNNNNVIESNQNNNNNNNAESDTPHDWEDASPDVVMAKLKQIKAEVYEKVGLKPFYKSYNTWEKMMLDQRKKAYAWYRRLTPDVRGIVFCDKLNICFYFFSFLTFVI
jgi:hypothetical protein